MTKERGERLSGNLSDEKEDALQQKSYSTDYTPLLNQVCAPLLNEVCALLILNLLLRIINQALDSLMIAHS